MFEYPLTSRCAIFLLNIGLIFSRESTPGLSRAYIKAGYLTRRRPTSMSNAVPSFRSRGGPTEPQNFRQPWISWLPFPLTHRLKRLRILDSLGSTGFLGIWLVNDEMKAPRFSTIELKVEGMARRRANHQLLRVPWGRFSRAYDEYPRWQGLALWGELLAGTGARGQSSVLATINKHCPGLVEGRSRLQQSTPLGLDLLEWVHTQKFDYAKRQGWLDALIFYGVRHPFSRGAWAY